MSDDALFAVVSVLFVVSGYMFFCIVILGMDHRLQLIPVGVMFLCLIAALCRKWIVKP